MPLRKHNWIPGVAYVLYVVLGATALWMPLSQAFVTEGAALFGAVAVVLEVTFLAPIAILLSILQQIRALEWKLILLVVVTAGYGATLYLGFEAQLGIAELTVYAVFGVVTLVLCAWHFKFDEKDSPDTIGE
jgi:hypothetical protein